MDDVGKVLRLLGVLVALLVGWVLFSKMVDNTKATEYKIKQAAVVGTMSCHADPGWFMQAFGDIHQYDRTGTFYFSIDTMDGGNGDDSNPLLATFQGNSTAEISGYLKYQLPTNCEKQILLHRDFGNQKSVRMDLIRNAIATALKMTGPQFTPEEAYIDRRPEFTQLVREILEDGEYRTITDEVIRYEGGDSAAAQKFKVTRMWLDSNGNREITKRSVLDHYGIQVIALDIKDFNFDQKTEELIQTKKEAEQKRVAARALAEKAKQDAITAREQGNANIATAKAAEEVEKIKAVTQAQKEFEVAQYNAKRAEEEAKKTRADGEAQAYADRLKVAAGLTPLERATIDKETRIGVAAEIAKVKFPSTMIISGGGANGRGTDPFEAVGLQSLYDLSKKMSQ